MMLAAHLGARSIHTVFWTGLVLLGIFNPFVPADSGRFVFLPQAGTPAAIQNFIQPAAACNWMGIGGQVFDRSGLPVTGLVVKLTGTLDGKAVAWHALSGSSLQFTPGGFDIHVADHPVATHSLTIQLLDVLGEARSRPFVLQTYDSCQKNLVVINLVERFVVTELFFPLVRR
jgi:hypothetical protein